MLAEEPATKNPIARGLMQRWSQIFPLGDPPDYEPPADASNPKWENIDGLVGNAIRPMLNTDLDLASMTIQELIAAGGAGACGVSSASCCSP